MRIATLASLSPEESRLVQSVAVLACERNCTMKNRMPELGSSGTVRGEGSNVLVYSDRARISLGKEKVM